MGWQEAEDTSGPGAIHPFASSRSFAYPPHRTQSASTAAAVLRWCSLPLDTLRAWPLRRRCRPGHGLYVQREGVHASPQQEETPRQISVGDVIENTTDDEDDEDGSGDDDDSDEGYEEEYIATREALLQELQQLEARNRKLRSSARDLRSAHSRSQRLEAEVGSLERQLGLTVPILATAAVSENGEGSGVCCVMRVGHGAMLLRVGVPVAAAHGAHSMMARRVFQECNVFLKVRRGAVELRMRLAEIKDATAVAITEMVEAKMKLASLSGTSNRCTLAPCL